MAAGGPEQTPYERRLSLEYGLREDGRMRTCPTDANPNCISTASTNDTYMPAWEAGEDSPQVAMSVLEGALLQLEPQAECVATASTPTSEYRRWQLPDALFDHDMIEVLISVQQPPYDRDPPLVTFRSMAATVRYIWPVSQAIMDGGAQRKRVKALRQRLGWRVMGCDLVECYQE